MSDQTASAKAAPTTTQVSAEELDRLVALSLACEEAEEQKRIHEERPYDEHMDSDIDSVGAVNGDCSLEKPKKYSTSLIPPHLLKRPFRRNQFVEYNSHPQAFMDHTEQIPVHRETEWYSNTEPTSSQATSKISPFEANTDNRTPKDPPNSNKVENAVGQVIGSDDSMGDFSYVDNHIPKDPPNSGKEDKATGEKAGQVAGSDDSIGDFSYVDDDDEDYYIQDESDDEKKDENHGDDENDDDDEEYYYESSVGDDENSAREESSEASSNASSFELVFHGIHSVEVITLETIENCNSLPDMEHICNELEASSENRSLRKAAAKRFLVLRQQEKQQQEEEDSEFVVVPSNDQKTDAETTKAIAKSKEDDATYIINNTTAATSPTKEKNRAPNLNAEMRKPYSELTAPNLRSAIEMYAKENPEDIGMPMKKLMKFFGIKKKTSKQTQKLFQKIVNEQCLLVNTDETGRVLFLKNSNGDYLGVDDDQETKQTNDQDIVEDEENCKMNAVTIGYIQKCTSIKELQGILARLDESLPRHIAIATARIRVLRETIPLSDITANIEDSDDTDSGGSSDDLDSSARVAVSPQTTTENYSEDLDYMMALRMQFDDSSEETLEEFSNSQDEQSSSTPPRSNQSSLSTNNKAWWNDLDNYGVESAVGGVGQMNTSPLMRHHPIPRSKVPSYSIAQNQTPEFRPPGQMSVNPESNMSPVICPQNPTYSISQNPQLSSFHHYEDSIPISNISSSNMTQISTPQSQNIIWIPATGSYHCPYTRTNILPSYEPQNPRIVPGYGPPLPTFYYYDDSVPELRDFWEIPCDVERENRALKYIENCDFKPELEGIIHFGSEPENLTSFHFHSSKVYAAVVKRINTVSLIPSFRMPSFKRYKWSVREVDIELTHNTQDRAFRRKGNIWLENLIEANLEYFEKDHRYFKTILWKVKEEGRRFFRLGGGQPSHPRLFWIHTYHSDVRAEIFRLFRSERENRNRRSTPSSLNSNRFSSDGRFTSKLELAEELTKKNL